MTNLVKTVLAVGVGGVAASLLVLSTMPKTSLSINGRAEPREIASIELRPEPPRRTPFNMSPTKPCSQVTVTDTSEIAAFVRAVEEDGFTLDELTNYACGCGHCPDSLVVHFEGGRSVRAAAPRTETDSHLYLWAVRNMCDVEFYESQRALVQAVGGCAAPPVARHEGSQPDSPKDELG